MHETDLQLPRHLDKLHGQGPQPFLRYADPALSETVKVPIIIRKPIAPLTGAFTFFLIPFLFFLIIGITFLWFLPLDWVYRLVLSILCVIIGYSLITHVDTMLMRWKLHPDLLTQRVPAIQGDPLRKIAQDLNEDTNMYLKRIIV